MILKFADYRQPNWSAADRLPLLAACAELGEDDADYTLKVGTNVCPQDESIEGDVCFSSDPIVRLGPRPCDDLESGVTPHLLAMDFTYFQKSETEDGVTVEFSRNIWVGVELSGNGCI